MIQNIRRSLTDLLGAEYTAAVWRASAAHTGGRPTAQAAEGGEEGEFYNAAFYRRPERPLPPPDAQIPCKLRQDNRVPALCTHPMSGRCPEPFPVLPHSNFSLPCFSPFRA